MNGPLPPGITESGTWVAASGVAPEASEPGAPREVAGAISFPVPLATAPKVHYLNNEQSKKGTAECPGKSPGYEEHPQAASGNLCVYTGKEILKFFVSFESIQNVAGETEKASATGAFVVFGAQTTSPGNNVIDVQGTWAVTG
jgi:hypothetical protein